MCAENNETNDNGNGTREIPYVPPKDRTKLSEGVDIPKPTQIEKESNGDKK